MQLCWALYWRLWISLEKGQAYWVTGVPGQLFSAKPVAVYSGPADVVSALIGFRVL